MNRRVAGIVGIALVAGVVTALAGSHRSAVAAPQAAAPEVVVAGATQVTRSPLTAVASSATVGSDEPPAAVGGAPALGVAIAGDASAEVVVDQRGGGAAATEVRTADDAVLGTAVLPGAAGGGGSVAFDPTNPGRAYAVAGGSTLYVLGVGASLSVTATPALVGIDARSVAVSPDGSTVYVGGQDPITDADVVEAVAAATGAPGARWQAPTVGAGDGVTGLALRPDGRTLFAADGSAILQSPLPLPAAPALTTATAAGGVDAVTVSPSGATVYGAGSAGGRAFVVATSTTAPGPATPVPVAGSGPVDLAVDPAGATLVTAAGAGAAELDVIPLHGEALGPPTAPVVVSGTGGPVVLAITPDQAPVAAIAATPAPAGSPTPLDAGASTVAYGTITAYRWTFGDGASTTTSAPTTTHTYTAAGTYTATVTEVDGAGTGPPPAVAGFAVASAGRTPYRRASRSAIASTPVVVAGPGATTTTVAPGARGSPGQALLPGATRLSATPPVGAPGTIVTVQGTGFSPDTTVVVAWSTSVGQAEATTDAAGSFTVQLPTLVPDVLGPRQVVVPSAPGVTAPFLVVPGGAQPGGSGGTPFVRPGGG